MRPAAPSPTAHRVDRSSPVHSTAGPSSSSSSSAPLTPQTAARIGGGYGAQRAADSRERTQTQPQPREYNAQQSRGGSAATSRNLDEERKQTAEAPSAAASTSAAAVPSFPLSPPPLSALTAAATTTEQHTPPTTTTDTQHTSPSSPPSNEMQRAVDSPSATAAAERSATIAGKEAAALEGKTIAADDASKGDETARPASSIVQVSPSKATESDSSISLALGAQVDSKERFAPLSPSVSVYASPAQAMRSREFSVAHSPVSHEQSKDETKEPMRSAGEKERETKTTTAPSPEEELEGWTIVEKPTMKQRLSDLWSAAAPKLESTSRDIARKMRRAGGSAKKQWNEMMAHEDVQSLMRSTSSTVTRSARRYADSLQCMLSSVSTLPLESLLPIIASVVLHLFVPLLYFRFAESRTALCWFAVCFALSHALYHFTPLSIGEAVSLSRMCALLPMTFELWMSAGVDSWFVAYPDWPRILRATPENMQLYLLWFRSTLMVNFATLCGDFARLLQWKQTTDQTTSSAAQAEVKTAAAIRSKGTADASTQLPSSAEAGPAAATSPRDRKSASFSLPLSDADAGRGPSAVKTEGHSVESISDAYPPLSSIALLPVKAEIRPEAAPLSERKEAAAQ